MKVGRSNGFLVSTRPADGVEVHREKIGGDGTPPCGLDVMSGIFTACRAFAEGGETSRFMNELTFTSWWDGKRYTVAVAVRGDQGKDGA